MTFSQYLAAAPDGAFIAWTVAAALLAAAGFVAGFVCLRRGRLMEDMPTSRIRAAAQGYVEFEGQARLMDGPQILSPLTGFPCAWWRFRIEQKETYYEDGRRHTRWRTIRSGTSDDAFLIDDGTGRCVVDPVGASVIPTSRQRWYGTSAQPLAGNGVHRGFWLAALGNYRFTEELIPVQAPVYVLGAYRTQAGGPDPVDEQADLRDLLTKWKHDKRMMALFDTNRDGHVDMKEWDAARRMGLQRVRQEHVQRAVETPDLHLVAKPRDGRPYILSGIPQAKLVRRYRRYAFAGTALAAAGAAFCVWALQLRGIL